MTPARRPALRHARQGVDGRAGRAVFVQKTSEIDRPDPISPGETHHIDAFRSRGKGRHRRSDFPLLLRWRVDIDPRFPSQKQAFDVAGMAQQDDERQNQRGNG